MLGIPAGNSSEVGEHDFHCEQFSTRSAASDARTEPMSASALHKVRLPPLPSVEASDPGVLASRSVEHKDGGSGAVDESLDTAPGEDAMQPHAPDGPRPAHRLACRSRPASAQATVANARPASAQPRLMSASCMDGKVGSPLGTPVAATVAFKEREVDTDERMNLTHAQTSITLVDFGHLDSDISSNAHSEGGRRFAFRDRLSTQFSALSPTLALREYKAETCESNGFATCTEVGIGEANVADGHGPRIELPGFDPLPPANAEGRRLAYRARLDTQFSVLSPTIALREFEAETDECDPFAVFTSEAGSGKACIVDAEGPEEPRNEVPGFDLLPPACASTDSSPATRPVSARARLMSDPPGSPGSRQAFRSRMDTEFSTCSPSKALREY